MKKHILYQRNSKGQYYAGLTQNKLILFSTTFLLIVSGLSYSVVAGRTRNAQVPMPEANQHMDLERYESGAGEVGTPCKKTRPCDLTDDATKIRIYELTEKGTKQIKWYGKTKISPVTAYTSRVQETDASPCISADGSDICKRYANGEKICASNDYKLGSVIEVQGLGKCVVADRMNKRYTGTGRVDWYMGMDLVSARKWGLRHVAISSF